tara:strand:- start:615 stop:1163 length:549 start_codon:yes stop_codon:yes gene_type:complete
MKVSKRRLLQIVYEEVEKLKEGRFSDTTKSVMDNPTKYKMPIKQKSYMPPDQKGAYREPPEYALKDDDPFYFGDTISETILDMITDNVGEDNPEVDSLRFVEKLTHYIYNQMRRQIGEQQWVQLETEWDERGHTQTEPGLITDRVPQKWLQDKMKQDVKLNNAVMTAYRKFADMADPEGWNK